VTADANGNFIATKNYGTTCNNITATKTNYTCETTTNGPVSLTNDTTNIAGNCVANIQTNQACIGKPTNSAYNTATTISQTWNGTAWAPSTTAVHNTTASTSECRFKCDS